MNKADTEKVMGFIKAITAAGGEHEAEFRRYFTPENDALFNAWLEEQPRVSGVELYRGYRLEENMAEAFELGAIIAPLNMADFYHAPFTTHPLLAVRFMSEYGSSYGRKFYFKLITSGKYLVDISRYSYYNGKYDNEHEHQPTQNARFEITGIKERGGYTEIQLKEI